MIRDLFDRKFQKVNFALATLSGATLIAMACMITYDVIVRFLFNAPLPASVEISTLMEPYVVFLPFAYTLARHAHVRVNIVTMRLPERVRLGLDILVYVLDLLFFALLCYFSWLEFYKSFLAGEIMLAAIRLPWWSGKFAMPLGLFFICIQCLLHIDLSFRSLAAKRFKEA
jgi:TRAP-type C4-dicarboxylate transport system permease small subunit